MPTTATDTWSMSYLQPVSEPGDATVRNINLADGTYTKGQIVGEKSGTNEVQTVTISATGGTFTLTFGGQTTSAIAYNAAASAVQTALEALSTIGANNVSVSGSAGGPYTVTFQNALGSSNVAQLTSSAASLTGGSGTVTHATTTAGSAGTPGTFAAYSASATDGTQTPRAILKYGCTVSSGVVSGISEWGSGRTEVPAYFANVEFNTADLVSLTGAILTAAGWRLLSGTVVSGIVRLP